MQSLPRKRPARPLQWSILLLGLAALLAACSSQSSGASSSAPGQATTLKVYKTADMSNLEAQAKKEGTLNLYIAPDYSFVQKAFEAAYPWAKVNMTQLLPVPAVTKWSAEVNASVNQVDVVGVLPNQISSLRDLRAVAGVQVPNDLLVSSSLQDPNGFGHPMVTLPIVILYNTKLTSTPPKDLSELIEPQWKGQLVMDNPATGPTASWALAAERKVMGDAQWDTFLAGLKANGPELTDSASESYAALVRGDRPICICSYSDYVAQKPGAPVAVDFYDQDSQGVVIRPIDAVVAAKAPHPAMAALFLNWMLSPTGGQQLMVNSGRIPAVSVPGATKGNVPSGVKVVPQSSVLSDYLDNPDSYVTAYKKYFG
jgi:ABC-type Fe3+ transport system substrate-binding protein